MSNNVYEPPKAELGEDKQDRKGGFGKLVMGLFGIILAFWSGKYLLLKLFGIAIAISRVEEINYRALGEETAPIFGYGLLFVVGLFLMKKAFKSGKKI
ncbi:MAG: hypothetical protein AB2689_11995 [Candidatus Thiodiazotropha taylori]